MSRANQIITSMFDSSEYWQPLLSERVDDLNQKSDMRRLTIENDSNSAEQIFQERSPTVMILFLFATHTSSSKS